MGFRCTVMTSRKGRLQSEFDHAAHEERQLKALIDAIEERGGDPEANWRVRQLTRKLQERLDYIDAVTGA